MFNQFSIQKYKQEHMKSQICLFLLNKRYTLMCILQEYGTILNRTILQNHWI
jgi:hypothetical protein